MTEDASGARVTIRKRSNSGEGAAVGGAEPVRQQPPAQGEEEGRLTAVTFHFTPLPRHAGVSAKSTVLDWATGRIAAAFGRPPSIDAEAGALYFLDGPWPDTATLTKFADELEIDAERLGYRCICESTLRW
jgi:hypothetical protein